MALVGLAPGALSAAGQTAAAPANAEVTGQLVPAADKDAAWVAAQRAAYPLTTCVVSDEALEGDMGGPQDFVYEQAGQPDAFVRFCCKHCVRDFKQEPQKFLAEIAAARAKQAGKK